MLGGDLRVRDLHMERLALPGGQSLFPSKTSDPSRMSMLAAVLLVMKVQICTDSFLIPAQFQVGLLPSLFLCLSLFALSQVSFHIYVRTWTFGHAYTYPDIWAQTINPSTRWIPDILIILGYMTQCSTGAWEIQRYGGDLITTLIPTAPDWVSSSWFLEYGFSVIVMIPCFFVRAFSQLLPVAIIGFSALVIAAISLFIHVLRVRFPGEEHIVPELVMASTDLTLWIVSFECFNGAFFFHPFRASIVHDMERPTRTRTITLPFISNTICAIVTF
jgi:hypothetical protein